MSVPGGAGAWRTRGRRESPPMRGMTRCAIASMGTCFLMGGVGTAERQLRGRYKEDKPLVRCREECWALRTEREGKEEGRRAAAGLWVGEAQAIRRAASLLRYLQYAAMGVRQTSRVWIEVGIE